ncbi:hypothetical protein B0H14DRAFT_2650976 [Mycena olivaceomarginata]|nr:hypothetical protein B0H14DRAFT_2650976 [Mycena olivaceomarginata]
MDRQEINSGASTVSSSWCQDKQQREREAAENSQRLKQAYSAAPVDLIPHNTEPDTLPTGMYEHPRSPSPAWAEYTAAGLHAPSVPSFITTAVHDRGLEHERLKQQVARILVQSEESDDEDNDLSRTVDAFKDLDLETEDDVEEETLFSNVPVSRDYAPYPDKVSMLLDILDNLPRLRMSMGTGNTRSISALFDRVCPPITVVPKLRVVHESKEFA